MEIKVKDISGTPRSFFFFFLGLHPKNVEVPGLGVESVLWLLAYATATVMQDPSRICGLHHSPWQRWILNPLTKARDRTQVFMDTSQVLNPVSHNGNSLTHLNTDCILIKIALSKLELCFRRKCPHLQEINGILSCLCPSKGAGKPLGRTAFAPCAPRLRGS